jgi:hypothetical protein
MSSMKPLISESGLGTLERPVYSPGLLLEDEDLTTGVSYTRRLTQLLFRSLFGCGVICGLTVEARLVCNRRHLKVTVDPGLGLDCLGNPIEVTSTVEVVYDPGCEPIPERVWVVACYLDRDCAPREVACGCDGGNERAMTRQRSGFEIRLYPSHPECACSCERPERKPEADPDCRCPPGEVPAAPAAAAVQQTPPADPEAWRRAGLAAESCYLDHVRGLCDCGCGCTCILLGVVTIPRDPYAEQTPGDVLAVDDRGVRRIRPWLIGMTLEQARPPQLTT